MNIVRWGLLLHILIKKKMEDHREEHLIIWIIGLYPRFEKHSSPLLFYCLTCQCEAHHYPNCLIKGKLINVSEIVFKYAIIGIRHSSAGVLWRLHKIIFPKNLVQHLVSKMLASFWRAAPGESPARAFLHNPSWSRGSTIKAYIPSWRITNMWGGHTVIHCWWMCQLECISWKATWTKICSDLLN